MIGIMRIQIFAVDNFSVMSGWSQRFLGIDQFCGKLNLKCLAQGGGSYQTQDISLLSSVLYHYTAEFPLTMIIIEPPRGKTNNVVSEQVRHKPSCTSTEAG